MIGSGLRGSAAYQFHRAGGVNKEQGTVGYQEVWASVLSMSNACKGTVKGLESRLQAAECARFWAGEEVPGYRYAASCRQWSTPGRDARRTGANMAALHLRSKRKEHTLESWLVHELTYVQV